MTRVVRFTNDFIDNSSFLAIAQTQNMPQWASAGRRTYFDSSEIGNPCSQSSLHIFPMGDRCFCIKTYIRFVLHPPLKQSTEQYFINAHAQAPPWMKKKYLGVVFKWRHAILDILLPSPPSVTLYRTILDPSPKDHDVIYWLALLRNLILNCVGCNESLNELIF